MYNPRSYSLRQRRMDSLRKIQMMEASAAGVPVEDLFPEDHDNNDDHDDDDETTEEHRQRPREVLIVEDYSERSSSSRSMVDNSQRSVNTSRPAVFGGGDYSERSIKFHQSVRSEAVVRKTRETFERTKNQYKEIEKETIQRTRKWFNQLMNNSRQVQTTNDKTEGKPPVVEEKKAPPTTKTPPTTTTTRDRFQKKILAGWLR